MIRAKLSYLRISPRKVRLIADLIRGKSVMEAERILNFAVKRGAKDILKLLKSATASAAHNFQLEESNLYVAKITVDDGPKLKRWRPRARGSASEIQKKTAHVAIMLDEIEKGKIAAIKDEDKSKKEKTVKAEKPKFEIQKEAPRPRMGAGLKKMFRRKAI